MLATLAAAREGHGAKPERVRMDVNCVAAAPDGRIITGSNGNVMVWRDGACERTIPAHDRNVDAVAVLPGVARFVSVSGDLTAKLWALDGALERTFEVGWVLCVAALPDGVHFVVGLGNCEVRLFHVDGTLVHTFKGHTRPVIAVAVTPDGQHIISGSWDYPVKVWSVASRSLVSTCAGHTDDIEAVAAMPDAQRFLSGGCDKTVRVWLLDGTLENTFNLHTNAVEALVALPDNQHALSASYDKTIKLFNVNDGAVLLTFKHHTGPVTSLALLPDGLRFVSGSVDGTTRIANAEKTDAEVLKVSSPSSTLGKRPAGAPSYESAATRVKHELNNQLQHSQLRGSRLVPLDVLVLCSPATDLEKHHEAIKINQALSKLRPQSFYDDPQARRYVAAPLMSMVEARSRHQIYVEEQHPMPAVVHLICHADKSTTFEFDEDVKFDEITTLFCTAGTHCLLNCCNGWQYKASQVMNMRQPPASIISWRIQPENRMCIALTEVYYDLLCRPDGHAPTLAENVANDPRVQAIRVPTKLDTDGETILDDRRIVVDVVKGTQKPRADADLVAWSRE
jgi:hypothetical protein